MKCPFCTIPCGNSHCPYSIEEIDKKEVNSENQIKSLKEENTRLKDHIKKLEDYIKKRQIGI